MTEDELEKREAILEREITERQKLREAYRLVREDMARSKGRNGATSDDDSSALLFAPRHEGESEAQEKQYGENTRLVKTAISKMTDDYTIRDVHNYLRTHGYQLGMNPIATVLNRLKKNGEIKVRVAGIGRRPTLFKR